MTAADFSRWIMDPELAAQGHLAIFNDGDKDYLVCRHDFIFFPIVKDRPAMAEFVARIEKSTIVSPVASREEIDRISKQQSK